MNSQLDLAYRSFDLIQLETPAQLEQAGRDGLFELYCTIFAEPPYEEWFEVQDVGQYFADMQSDNGVILVGYSQRRLVSFAASIPLQAKPEVAKFINDRVGERDRIDISTTCYLGEDAVVPEKRRQGFSKQQKCSSIAFNRVAGYKRMILRTNDSADNPQIAAVQQLPGVRQILDARSQPLIQDVASLRLDGQMRTDRRRFFKIDLDDPAYGVP